MLAHRLLFLASLLGATGVTLGAFGAHALRERLIAAGTLSTWDKAVLYHLIHALAVLVVGVSTAAFDQRGEQWLRRAGFSWTLGVVFFSGSLYALALGGPRWLGPVTPLGGLAMIAGWIFVMVAGTRVRRPNQP